MEIENKSVPELLGLRFVKTTEKRNIYESESQQKQRKINLTDETKKANMIRVKEVLTMDKSNRKKHLESCRTIIPLLRELPFFNKLKLSEKEAE